LVETGHFALVLALALSLVQAVVPLVGARRSNIRLMSVGEPVAITVFAMTGLAFAVLVAAYVQSDFSVVNVIENSHSQSRCSTRSPARGETMKARCCCGC
jgi:cytochrome c-type biogenesis protein CcmF